MKPTKVTKSASGVCFQFEAEIKSCPRCGNAGEATKAGNVICLVCGLAMPIEKWEDPKARQIYRYERVMIENAELKARQ